MLAAIGVAMLGGIATAITASATSGIHKDYVCKYVSKPGEAERLQTGGNPIWVDTAATGLGWFNDAQGRSYVIVFNTLKLDPEPLITACPAPSNSVLVLRPTYTPPTCDAPSTIIPPVDTDFYGWVLGDGVWTAIAKEGYTLTGDTTFPVLLDDQLSGADCVIRVLPPVYTPPTCTAIGTLTVPAPVGYEWRISDEGRYTAVVIDKNYTLSGNTGPFGPFPLAQVTGAQCPTIRTFNPDTPGISLVKSYTLPDSSDAFADAGETIAYSFVVTNTGNVALTSVAVVDLMTGVSAVSCPSTTLAPAATFTCTASYIVTSANVTGADIVNEANASGQPPTGVRVEDTATVSTPTVVKPVVAGVVKNAPVVAGVVKNAPVVAGVVENAPAVKSLAFTGAETIPLGLSGLLALVLGAVLTVASRQRPKQARE